MKLTVSKRLAFALIPLLFFLAVASALLSNLEKQKIIRTESADDVASYNPPLLLKKQSSPNGDRFIFSGLDMVTGSIPVEKSKNAFRIVCVGGSFLMGFPYTQQNMENPGLYGIPYWLQLDLAMRYPNRQIEVYNMAVIGQNSRRVLDIIKKAMRIEPDLFIVSTGNNEGNLAPPKLNEALHKWVLYRAMKRALVKKPKQRPAFTAQDPDVRAIEEHFRENILAIIETCRQNSVPLLLATPPINLRFHDFLPDTHQGGIAKPQNADWFENAKISFAKMNYQDAISQLEKHSSDPYAVVYMAKAYDYLGYYDKARDFYRIFAQMNPLTRTRPSFNEFVREQSAAGGFVLVDLEKEIEGKSVGKIPHKALFLDYCHMKWWANQMLARSIANAIDAGALIENTNGRSPSQKEILSKYNLGEILLDDGSKGRELFVAPWESDEGMFPAPPRPQ